jgi:hypothetical protein
VIQNGFFCYFQGLQFVVSVIRNVVFMFSMLSDLECFLFLFPMLNVWFRMFFVFISNVVWFRMFFYFYFQCCTSDLECFFLLFTMFTVCLFNNQCFKCYSESFFLIIIKVISVIQYGFYSLISRFTVWFRMFFFFHCCAIQNGFC